MILMINKRSESLIIISQYKDMCNENLKDGHRLSGVVREMICLDFVPKKTIKEGLILITKKGDRIRTDLLKGVKFYNMPQYLTGESIWQVITRS